MMTSAIVRPDQTGSAIPLFSPAARSSASEGEVPFGFDEIFCSRTDGRGVIQAGNAVFRRVSGYEVSRLVGAPHKIVRNPIMPKAAFHMLWERLRAGKPTGLYVRNRSLDGRGYWVFAVNFPIRDGFMSVRIKPGSTHFDRVRDIYKDLHAAEAKGATPAEGAAELIRRITKDGFASYDSFQAQALAAEVTGRAAQCRRPEPHLTHLVTAVRAADGIEIELAAMQRMFRVTLNITTNLRIVAGQLGVRGRALSAVADNYALLSNEMTRWIDQRTAGTSGDVRAIAGSVSENSFLYNASALLDEMSGSFALDAEAGMGDPQLERARLSETAGQYRDRSVECSQRAVADALVLEQHLSQMSHHVDALDAIRMLCRIEHASVGATDGFLEEVVNQLDTFQDKLGVILAKTMTLGRDIQRAQG